METLQRLDMENWNREVIQAEGPLLVDFRAPWCDPHLLHNDELEDFQREWRGFARVVFADAFRFRVLVFRHQVGEFPTLALFQDGHWVKAFGGAGRVKALREWLLTPEAMAEEDPVTHTLRDAFL
jgi:thioredoxin-like negative regulator of GroEL